MATQLHKTRITAKRIDVVSSIPRCDSSFWFRSELPTSKKAKKREKLNDFREHENNVKDFINKK